MKKIKVISIITTICIMALIFFFSSQTREESASVSRGLLEKIVEIVIRLIGGDKQLKKEVVSLMHDFIRTAAHFTIFALLGCSAAVMFLSNTGMRGKRLFFLTLAFCFVYACSDEIHQIFVSGRAFQLSDVFTDTSGSLAGILTVILIKLLFNKRKGTDKI